MEDKFKIKTKVGTLEVLTETNEKYPGILIRLDGIPVTFIEQTMEYGEYKLIQKDYNNKKVSRPIDGINYSKYQIDLDKVEELRKQMK